MKEQQGKEGTGGFEPYLNGELVVQSVSSSDIFPHGGKGTVCDEPADIKIEMIFSVKETAFYKEPPVFS